MYKNFPYQEFLVLTCMCFCFITAANSEQSFTSETDTKGVLTPQAVLQSVWAHHPRLKQEIIQLSEARARTQAAQGEFDVKLKADNKSWVDGYYSGNNTDSYIEVPLAPARSNVRAGYRIGRGEFPIYEDEYQTNDGGEWRLEGDLSLLRNFSTDERRLGVKLAELENNIAELGVETSKLLLGEAALQQYWNWVLLWKEADVYKTLLEVAQTRQKQLDIQVAAGNLARFEALDNKRTILQRKSLHIKREALAKQAAQKLSLFLRDVDGKPRIPEKSELPASTPIPSENEWQINRLIDIALSNRPDLLSFKFKTDQLEKEIEFHESRFLPDLNLLGSVSKDQGYGSETREGTEVKVLLGLEVPLQQRKNHGKLTESKSKLKRVSFKLQYLKEQLENDIRQILTDLKQSKERYAIGLQEKETTVELAKGEFSKFKTGDSNLLFLNIREVGAAEAEINVYSALRENLIKKASLAATVGDFDIIAIKPNSL